ncbi:MAG: UDP-N-acetylmuramate--L-alanine ligase [Actinomycetota bacterium]
MSIHFVGIGGSGMSGIARVMAARGARISGSDLHDSTTLDSLRALDFKIQIGHHPENVEGADLVIRSSAIPSSNPEIIAANNLGISVIGRAEALAALLIGKRSVAVAGTHGKTTTTSMLTVALQRSGLDPSFAIGASIRNSGTNAHHGSGEIFVVEADESDGSFTSYHPAGAVITNIELDHVDNFQNLEQIDDLFSEFCRTVQDFIVVCSDDAGISRLLQRISGSDLKIVTYGTEADPNLLLDRIHLAPTTSSARLTFNGRVLGEMKLAIPGRHNLLNAAAAMAAGIELGAPVNKLLEGIASFSGARRRFEIRGEVNGVTVIDDYGHHPTEIKATLETARSFAGSGRVIVIFQPHRFSRTKAFADEFAQELGAADHTYLLEIYPADEQPIAGVTSAVIAHRMSSKSVTYEPSMPDVITQVVSKAKQGDLVLTLGAGDVTALAPLILENLQRK